MPFDPKRAPVPADLGCPLAGRIRSVPEDFLVEELPLYPFSGDGEHLILLVEKKDLTTQALVQRLGKHLHLKERDIGCAGLKDRHAVTRQHLSVPRSLQAALADFQAPGVRILAMAAHKNKLRLGHLLGNRFTITVRGTAPDAAGRVAPILERVEREGLPNGFGPQRFGARFDNHLLGESLARHDAHAFFARITTPLPEIETPRIVAAREHLQAGRHDEAYESFPPDFLLERHLARALAATNDLVHAVRTLPYRPRDFLIGAWQSACFNAVLEARLAVDRLLIPGDVAMKLGNGACFLVKDAELEMPRARALEICATGPLPGPAMLRAEGEALEVETAALAAAGFGPLDPQNPPPAGAPARLPPGTRRALRAIVKDASASTDAMGHLVLAFTLPSGAFATSLLGLFGFED